MTRYHLAESSYEPRTRALHNFECKERGKVFAGRANFAVGNFAAESFSSKASLRRRETFFSSSRGIFWVKWHLCGPTEKKSSKFFFFLS